MPLTPSAHRMVSIGPAEGAADASLAPERDCYDGGMYFIVVKYQVKPEYAESFVERTAEFTEATRAEPGNLWFDWSRSVEDPNEFVLVEAFTDDDAASAHVNSAHFAEGLETMRPLLVETPRIVSRKVEGNGWDRMGELQIDE